MQHNENSVELLRVKLETRRKGCYSLAAKTFDALLPEDRSIKYRTVFRRALEQGFPTYLLLRITYGLIL